MFCWPLGPKICPGVAGLQLLAAENYNPVIMVILLISLSSCCCSFAVGLKASRILFLTGDVLLLPTNWFIFADFKIARVPFCQKSRDTRWPLSSYKHADTLYAKSMRTARNSIYLLSAPQFLPQLPHQVVTPKVTECRKDFPLAASSVVSQVPLFTSPWTVACKVFSGSPADWSGLPCLFRFPIAKAQMKTPVPPVKGMG